MEKTIGGRYRLEERVGVGGMAEVWVAHDLQLDRRVAVKLLGPRADPARFDREARAIASLSHPNICRLFDYGNEGGRPYMVFEHLPGGTLDDRFTPGQPLDDASTERIAGEIAAGLAHAHDRGLIHRDLKPQNIVFDEEGRAKIADFGIARMSGADTLTEDGTLLGTAAFMSPEQASGRPVTPASDVYSFGVILYRMLGGWLPFESSSAVEVARRHLHETPAPLSAVRPHAPPMLTALAESSLAKDPERRPHDGGALVARLAGSEAPTIIDSAPAVTQVMQRSSRRRRILALLGILLALLIFAVSGVALALFATRGDSTPPAATSSTISTSSASTGSTETVPAPPPPRLHRHRLLRPYLLHHHLRRHRFLRLHHLRRLPSLCRHRLRSRCLRRRPSLCHHPRRLPARLQA